MLDRLNRAPKTRAELRAVLARKNTPDDVAEAVLDRMTEVNLVDDEAYARAWVSSRQAGRGLARRALRQELQRKGIDPDVARDALDHIDPDTEREAARRLIAKKLRSIREIPADRTEREKLVRRLVGTLARKGYSPGMAAAVVREVIDDESNDA